MINYAKWPSSFYFFQFLKKLLQLFCTPLLNNWNLIWWWIQIWGSLHWYFLFHSKQTEHSFKLLPRFFFWKCGFSLCMIFFRNMLEMIWSNNYPNLLKIQVKNVYTHLFPLFILVFLPPTLFLNRRQWTWTWIFGRISRLALFSINKNHITKAQWRPKIPLQFSLDYLTVFF